MAKLPSVPKRIFQWYCHPELQEVILGDMHEQFEEDIQIHGLQKAKRRRKKRRKQTKNNIRITNFIEGISPRLMPFLFLGFILTEWI